MKTLFKLFLTVLFLAALSGNAQTVNPTGSPSTTRNSTVTANFGNLDLLQIQQTLRLVLNAIQTGTTTGSSNVVITNTPVPVQGTVNATGTFTTVSTNTNIAKETSGNLEAINSAAGVTNTRLSSIITLLTDATAAAPITAINGTVGINNTNMLSTLGIQINSVWTAVGGLTIQGSLDGSNWISFGATGTGVYEWANSNSAQGTIPSGATGIFRVNIAGIRYIRIIALGAVTGTAGMTIFGTNGSNAVVLQPNGTVPIGNIASISTAVVPGTAATQLGKAEDAVAGSGDVGVASLYQANSGLTALAANGDYVVPATNSLGHTIISPYADPANYKNFCSAAVTTTTSTQLFAAAGAGIRYYLTSLSASNDGATATVVNVLDGATVIWSTVVNSTTGYQDIQIPSSIRCTANTAVNFQCLTAGGNVRVCAHGYTGL